MAINITRKAAGELQRALRTAIYYIVAEVRRDLDVHGVHPDRQDQSWYSAVIKLLDEARCLRELLRAVEADKYEDSADGKEE